MKRQYNKDKALAAKAEHDEWQRFGAQQFARIYGPDEPEYTLADIKPELSKRPPGDGRDGSRRAGRR
ncbi:MAG: hypothetical protein ABSE73_01250 [Planctomycetota bacterium]